MLSVKKYPLKIKVISLVIFLFFTGVASGGEISCKGLCGKVLCLVAGDQDNDRIFAGTTEGLFVSEKGKNNWKEERLPAGSGGVKDICFMGGEVVVLTVKGLVYRKEDEGWEIKRTPGRMTGMSADNDGMVVWSEREIYFSGTPAGSISKLGLSKRCGRIVDVLNSGGRIACLSDGRFFICDAREKNWRDLAFHDANTGEEDEADMTEPAEEEESDVITPVAGHIEYCEDTDGFVVLDNGNIYMVAPDDMTYLKIPEKLPSAYDPVSVGYGGGTIFALAGDGVFALRKDGHGWDMIFRAPGAGSVPCMEIYGSGECGTGILLGRGSEVYELCMGNVELPDTGTDGGYGEWFMAPGPDIKEVCRKAVEYADVSPSKIRKWRDALKWKGLFPRVSLSFSESSDDNKEIYTSATTSYVFEGPRETDNDWGVNFTWDLSELVWDASETSIDVRSKLMVQLRNDILDEVTRLYFERKRTIQLILDRERATGSRKERKDLGGARKDVHRVEELTAYIDAYTGGWFSTETSKISSDDTACP
ncbi:MAG: hypothetical protein PHH49_00800 [Candidatus Omnitrophica bacterium]|nr:hypothetical protein [Candidatus Omnitrophota bacterium]MDD5487490.1 hypothetical protein [Candidatus Omnitrophota bacterium]